MTWRQKGVCEQPFCLGGGFRKRGTAKLDDEWPESIFHHVGSQSASYLLSVQCEVLSRALSPPPTGVLLPRRQFSSSSSPDTPRTQAVLPSQLSSSSSPHTPPTTVVLQSRQFSSSSSPGTPRTTVALPSQQCSSSSSAATPRTKVIHSTTTSPVLIFQLPRYSAYSSRTTKPALIF